MSKENIQEKLIQTGRELVRAQGAASLTARKLSEASGFSVGTIYNQFGNMDNYVLIQNYLTLESLLNELKKAQATNAYEKINAYVQTFSEFVLNNKNFWFLLFNFHLNQSSRTFSKTYLRLVSSLMGLIENEIKNLFPNLKFEKRHISTQVLWISLFGLSALLTTDSVKTYSKLAPEKITKILLNTYLMGLKQLYTF